MEMEEELVYSVWLYMVKSIGEKTCMLLVKTFDSAKKVYEAALYGNMEKTPDVLEKKMPLRKWQELVKEARQSAAEMGMRYVKEKITEWSKQGIHIVVYGQEGYPKRLKEIPDPPFLLFYKGELPSENVPSVAIVGARECSAYGEFVAQELGKSLGKAGIQVISGMARGIDGISQRASLDEGGRSFGVLGCGVDICYPKTNQKLYNQLCEKGGVLSAYLPGTAPIPNGFPPRNRIVSGLADALVVVEARAKSGTLITVDMALEQGKDVFVVPGRITDRLSDGCNRLLALGASPVLTPTELIGHLLEICQYMGIQDRNDTAITRLKMNEDLESKEGRIKQCTKEKGKISIGFENLEESMGERDYRKDKNRAGETLADQIYALLERTPVSTFQILESLHKSTNIDFGTVTVELIKLCGNGLARQVSPGQFVKEK